jgi:lysophospholipase L1-like esterase
MPHAYRRYAIAFVGFFLLCGIVLTEVLLRHQYQNTHRKIAIRYQGRELCTMRSPDPRLIYSYIPNRCGANTNGYNDAEYAYEKNPGSYRIVVIGDSVAEGLSKTEKFGKILEERLNTNLSSHTGRTYEVIVLARIGYSTSQELIILEDEAFRYHPDLVLWSYVLNDPAHPVYHNANGELGQFWYAPQYHLLHALNRAMFRWREKIKKYKCEREFHKFLHCAYRDQIEADIRKIGDIGKQKHIPIIFLIHPIFEKGKTYTEYSLMPIHTMLNTIATSAGLTVWDLYEAFRNYDPQELQVTSNPQWYDPWHPNIKGHTIIAEYLYKKLTHGLLVQETPKQPK